MIEPYLFFNGRCEEAANFYRTALGAEITALMRFKDSPEPCGEGGMPPGTEEKIMHMNIKVGDAMFMASDGRCTGTSNFEGFALSLSPATEADAHRMFNALADGGKVEMPLGKTFWSPCFGMVTDRFGVTWMINVLPAQAPA